MKEFESFSFFISGDVIFVFMTQSVPVFFFFKPRSSDLQPDELPLLPRRYEATAIEFVQQNMNSIELYYF